MAEPTPRVIAMRIVNGFAEVGTPPTHDEVQSVARALISTQAELDALRRALERKAVLDNYGLTIENVKFDRWLEIVSSDSELEAWFGQPLEHYLLAELAEVLNERSVEAEEPA